MKQFSKRLLSLLIVAVMVCTMLPVTALAWSASDPYEKAPLTLNISSYGAPFISGSSGEHSISSISLTESIERSDVGSDNAEGSARAYFTKEGDTYWLTLDVKIGNFEHTYTHVSNARVTNKDMSAAGGDVTFGFSFNTGRGVSTYISISGAQPLPQPDVTHTLNYDLKGGQNAANFPAQTITNKEDSASFIIHSGSPTKEGYTFQGWSTTDGGSVTHQPSGSITVSGSATLYAVWEEVQSEPQTPAKPSDDSVMDLVNVVVYCGENELHGSTQYDLENNTFTVGDVAGNEDEGYSVAVTIYSASYVAKYNNNHELDDAETKTITLTWNDQAWVAGNSDYVSIKVKCVTESEPQPPTAPDANDVTKLLGNVTVYCGNVTTHEEKTYSLEANDVTIGQVSGDADAGYTVPVTIQTAPYAAKYGDGHELDDTDTKTVALTWDAEEEAWTTDAQVRIKVKCEAEDEGETWTIKLRIVEFSDDYNIGYSIVTGEATRPIPVDTNVNQFDVTVPSFNTVASELGYTMKDNYGFIGVSWDQAINADSTINIPTTNTNNQIEDVYVTSNGYTIWYVVKEAEPQPPVKPTAPTDEELAELLDGKVKVDCVNTAVNHADKTYGLLAGAYTKAVSEDGKTITVTLTNQAYCDEYNKEIPGHTLVANQAAKTLTVTHNGTAWVAGEGVTINVECETPAPEAPAAPTAGEVKAVVKVLIDCVNTKKNHDTWQYDLLDGTFTIGEVTEKDGVFTSLITIKADKYIEKYNKDEAKNHALAASNPDFCIIPFTYTEDGWKILFEGEEADTPVLAMFEVVCKSTSSSGSSSSDDWDDVPKTGDQSMLILGGCAAAIIMLAAAAVVLSKKKSVN